MSEKIEMLDQRPYIFDSYYSWIIDSGCRPHIVVNCSHPDVCVPQHLINADKTIVLNLTPSAISRFENMDDCITFTARFSGKLENIYIPLDALIAIYSVESGHGMDFQNMTKEMNANKPARTAPSAPVAESKVSSIFSVVEGGAKKGDPVDNSNGPTPSLTVVE
jgi:stringent starvation protein B